MHSSFALIPAFAAAVLAQGTALPDQQTTISANTAADCGGCFFIANVAQVIFADYTQTATASAVVSAGTGRNGTIVTTTLLQPAQPFSFNTAGLIGGSTVSGAYLPVSGTIITVNGATLTSPTAYNVFTAYTYFTKSNVGGSCVTSTGTPVVLSKASSYTISNGALASEVIDAENQFISDIGGVTCMAGGVVVSSTVAMPTTTTTVTSSTTGLARPSLLPDTTSASSTAAAAATSTSTSTSSANSTSESTSTSIVLLTPTPTIAIGTGATFQPRAFSATLVAALLVIPGIAAWML